MPPKSKGAAKAKDKENKPNTTQPTTSAAVTTSSNSNSKAKASPAPADPKTVGERSAYRVSLTRPYGSVSSDPSGLPAVESERTGWINAQFLARAVSAANSSSSSSSGGSSSGSSSWSSGHVLTGKAAKDLWRWANETGAPLRAIKSHGGKGSGGAGSGDGYYDWGRDRFGRPVADYTLTQFADRSAKRIALTALGVESRAFRQRRNRWAAIDSTSGGSGEDDVAETRKRELDEERERRRKMAALRAELYGERIGTYAQDPEWDDVVPVPAEEPDGALAAIAYPEDYAEATSYLRAVMAAKERSPRALRLTEHVISMNPAHYTVWLYRFAIVAALNLSVEDELAWLNGVALDHLKNYQIWHHRQLLLDHIYPKVESEGPAALARLRRSEGDFLVKMLAEDAKNYHVWSYRQHLVRRLSMWPSVHPAELAAVQALIDEDVRNNSAWSHRFFLVFSDPAVATPGSHSTERDPKIPESVIDREIAYATDKIRLAPQNQSPWNYLRGVLAKGGRGFSAVKQLAESFVSGLGGGDEAEQVLSSHALEFLAEAAAEAGDKDAAALALDRLAERWDRIRAGYWRWRKKVVLGEADSHVVGGSDDENKKMELPLREGPQVQAA